MLPVHSQQFGSSFWGVGTQTADSEGRRPACAAEVVAAPSLPPPQSRWHTQWLKAVALVAAPAVVASFFAQRAAVMGDEGSAGLF